MWGPVGCDKVNFFKKIGDDLIGFEYQKHHSV